LGRDKHTLMASILVPLFLYPALVWGTLQILLYARGLEDRTESRVLVLGGTPGDDLWECLSELPRLRLVTPEEVWGPAGEVVARCLEETGEAPPELKDAFSDARLDALLLALPGRGSEAGASPEQRAFKIQFSGVRDASRRGAERLQEGLKDYRRRRLVEEARLLGEGEAFLDVLEVKEENLSTPQELSNFVASLMLPLLMIVILTTGALYPALDATVGERERETLETTLVTPASRLAIVLGKYVAVVAFALLAFVLNSASMLFTFYHLQDQLKFQGLQIGFLSSLAIAAGATLLALFLSAVMMLLGLMAKSFKEGQSYLTPVYLLAMGPSFLASSPDVKLTPVLACVPVANVALLFREALRGGETVWQVALVLASSGGYAALALGCASILLRKEEFITGKVSRRAESEALGWARPGSRCKEKGP
jgi:sodium transport system permease protein